MSQKWNYNNMEFEVDLQDADFAERYEAAFERMALDEKKVQKAGKNSEVIRGYCGLFLICLTISTALARPKNCLRERSTLDCVIRHMLRLSVQPASAIRKRRSSARR